ncbi:MAG TPA: TetR family transcriptional regulator [Mycolicibacterium fallax]|nr:TetR family transcriptional regulator [Mycolicibacterium fallax]
MARPRVYDTDTVLDAVDALAAGDGAAAVSIRAISTATGVSNGALYHRFGSRGALLGHAWLRAGRRFLTLQNALVDEALADPGTDAAARAVLAAAEAPVTFAAAHPDSARLLLTVPRAQLLADGVPDDIAGQLRDLDGSLVALMRRLAEALWDRRDGAAIDAVTACIVDLPTALVLQRGRRSTPIALRQLRAAVEAVLRVGPAPPRRHQPTNTTTESRREDTP